MVEMLIGEAFVLMGATAAAWWTLSVAAWVVVDVRGRDRPIPIRLSLPGSRTPARTLVALALLASQACSAPASPSPPRLVHQADLPPAGTSAVPTPTPSATIPAVAVAPRPEVAERSHRVQPGDNLWSISAGVLSSHLSRQPTTAETSRYWLRVIDRNIAALRSGDADLIHPGESIVLPHP